MMTSIIWVVACAVLFVLISFIWVVASNWQDEDKAKLRASEDGSSTLTLEELELIDIERSFN